MNKEKWMGLVAGVFILLVLGGGLLIFKHSGPPAAMESLSQKEGPTGSASASPKEAAAASNAKVLFAQAERARVEGSLLEAKQLYQQIFQQPPPSDLATAVQSKLGEVNIRLLFSSLATPDSVIYGVEAGDNLSKIAKQFHTTIDLLKVANNLSSDRIRVGQRLKVEKAAFSIVVDKSQNTLTLKNGEEVLKIYRCSTGQGGNTPVGNFRIVNRIVNPPWYTPEGVIPPTDSRNVLGTRWLGFDQPGYGIHGTTDPSSIGKPVTKGCVRLTNNEVEELYTLLPEGTPVTIVD